MARNVTVGTEQVSLTTTGTGKDKQVDVSADNISVLNQMLEQVYGFKDLGSYFIERFNKGDSVGRIILDLRAGKAETSAQNKYYAAFPGMDEFLAEGGAFYGMDRPEGAYVDYKRTVTNKLQSYGLDVSRFGSADKIKEYIKANANPVVIANRIQQADAAVRTLPQEVKNMFNQYYNIQDKDLVAYYLDTTPEGENAIRVKEAAARIGQEAIAQGYNQPGGTTGITASTAENYAKYGVTPEEARRAFGEIKQQQALTTGVGETVTQKDLENAAIYGKADAIQKIKRIAGSRGAEFQKGGGFLESQRGVSGLGSSSS